MKASKKFNRLSVPTSVAGAHFFYKTEVAGQLAADRKTVTDAILRTVSENGLNPSEIEAYGPTFLQGKLNEQEFSAYERLRDLFVPERDKDKCSVLVCEWAAPHVDETFAGSAFVSLVLHTGPGAYYMSTFHTEHQANADGSVCTELVLSGRLLEEGSCVVFDPTTPHSASPMVVDSSSCLILLQYEVSEETEDERARLLEKYPPLDADRNILNPAYPY